jgi:hypothetical protein
MMESAIKVDIFPAVRKMKKYPSMYIPKLRTTLFQEVENDESVADPIQNMLVVLVKQIARIKLVLVSNLDLSTMLFWMLRTTIFFLRKNNNILSDVMPKKYTSAGCTDATNWYSALIQGERMMSSWLKIFQVLSGWISAST